MKLSHGQISERLDPPFFQSKGVNVYETALKIRGVVI